MRVATYHKLRYCRLIIYYKHDQWFPLLEVISRFIQFFSFHQFIVQNKYQNAPKKQTDFLHAVNWLFKIDYVSYSRRSDKARRVISGVQLKSRAWRQITQDQSWSVNFETSAQTSLSPAFTKYTLSVSEIWIHAPTRSAATKIVRPNNFTIRFYHLAF